MGEELATQICKFVKKAAPDFEFTSIQLNKNSASALHVDSGNMGPSLIYAMGQFEGGELYVHGKGKVNIKKRWYRFDGNTPHCTYPFTGTRYSLIFFVNQSYKLARKKELNHLERLGFKL